MFFLAHMVIGGCPPHSDSGTQVLVFWLHQDKQEIGTESALIRPHVIGQVTWPHPATRGAGKCSSFFDLQEEEPALMKTLP